ncbi:MAG: DUF2007 domain-containing protein [Sedimentisphaerales bacterium]|nr:DUF2007 domain-containing protein [Sedimentisphaerales bacterium]
MGKTPEPNKEFHDFVPLLFARNLPEAEFYKSLLEDHDIPVLIEDENTETLGLPDLARGVPVLVPDEMLAEAEDILEQRSKIDEDFDLETLDEDEDEEEDGDEIDGFSPLVDLEEIDIEEDDDEDILEEDDDR